MQKKYIITVVIPERFFALFEKFEALIEDDPKFKQSLDRLESRHSKKSKNNKLRSAKIRFLISQYINRRKKELLNNDIS